MEFSGRTVEVISYGAGGLSAKSTTSVLERAADGSVRAPDAVADGAAAAADAAKRSLYEQLRANAPAAVISGGAADPRAIRPAVLNEEDLEFLIKEGDDQRQREDDIAALERSDLAAFETAFAAARSIPSLPVGGVQVAAPTLARGAAARSSSSSAAPPPSAQAPAPKRSAEAAAEPLDAKRARRGVAVAAMPVAEAGAIPALPAPSPQPQPPVRKARLPPPSFGVDSVPAVSARGDAPPPKQPPQGGGGLVEYSSGGEDE